MPLLPDPPRSYRSMPFEELWGRVAGGDDLAWEEFLGRYQAWMLRTIRSRLGSTSRRPFDTGDVLQESLQAAFSGAKEFELRGEPALLGWIRRIITTTYFSMREREAARSGKRRRGDTELLTDERLANEDESARPSSVFSSREDRERLLRALSSLDDEDHRVLTLRSFEGHRWQQVAEAMGCSVPTVRKRYMEALRRLNRAM